MSLASALRDAAFRWIAEDVDPDDGMELQTVLASAMAGNAEAADELAGRMSGPLTFGTAGLRGPVRAGPNGMNRAVVIRTTAGVGHWLRHHGHDGGVVVVGRDARHRSATFCDDTAAVLAAAGFDVRVLPEPLPTPVLAFAVRELHAVAGVQITASHNPPADNGYKLYDDSGRQIAPPADREIEAAIAAVGAPRSVPRSGSHTTLGPDLLDAYLDRIAKLPRGNHRDVRIALTPLHGVGGAVAVEALRRAGFTDVRVVRSQAVPDPDLPTVAFPNPEEPGATDELLALAKDSDADLAIALDPDADRCAVGVPGETGWRMLRGDETGPLLGEHILSTMDDEDRPAALLATTIVSSALLGSIARGHGARYAETLTGFKWLTRAGDGLVYAYEEALGHCVDPDAVRDKDGISAAVLLASLAATAKAAGRTLPNLLDDLYIAHGVHLTEQVSIRFTEVAGIGALMARLRADPPTELAGERVDAEDLLPRADVLRLTGDGIRVVVRPSGTEPKLKAYLEIVEPVRAAAELVAARTRAGTRLSGLRDDIAARLS
ncbi:MAG TPA: phospho-sugar mutase [Pseudonocardiaceae bacterium]|nr:phospho-sugar mutase [Pseudonocardiaceae bacterium]